MLLLLIFFQAAITIGFQFNLIKHQILTGMFVSILYWMYKKLPKTVMYKITLSEFSFKHLLFSTLPY